MQWGNVKEPQGAVQQKLAGCAALSKIKKYVECIHLKLLGLIL